MLFRSHKHADDVDVVALRLHELKGQGLVTRPDDPKASTQFTFTRFLVPHLNRYKGWALFVDCDFLFRSDVNKLFEMKSYDELSKIVNDWIEGGMPTEFEGTTRGGSDSKTSAVSEDEEDSPPAPKTGGSIPKKTFKSLDDAFNDLIDS